MSVRRGRLARESHWTQVPNEFLRDRRLSRKARGLLAELLSHREGFVVSVASLVESGPEGRDAIVSGLLELRTYGYLRVEQGRGEGGRFGEVDYVLTDPAESPLPDYPEAGDPHTGDPTPKKTKPLRGEDHSLREASRAEALPGLESEDEVEVTKPPRDARADVERLALGVARIFHRDDARARVAAPERRAAARLLDGQRTTPDEVLAVLAFAAADEWWSQRIPTSWPALERAFVTMRKRMRTSGPAAVPVADDDDPLRWEPLAQDDEARASLFLSRAVNPERWWDDGRDQARLLATVLALPTVWRDGDLFELEQGWRFRGEGQSLVGNVPAWREVPV